MRSFVSLTLILFLTACHGSGGSTIATPTGPVTPSPTPTATPTPSAAPTFPPGVFQNFSGGSLDGEEFIALILSSTCSGSVATGLTFTFSGNGGATGPFPGTSSVSGTITETVHNQPPPFPPIHIFSYDESFTVTNAGLQTVLGEAGTSAVPPPTEFSVDCGSPNFFVTGAAYNANGSQGNTNVNYP